MKVSAREGARERARMCHGKPGGDLILAIERLTRMRRRPSLGILNLGFQISDWGKNPASPRLRRNEAAQDHAYRQPVQTKKGTVARFARGAEAGAARQGGAGSNQGWTRFNQGRIKVNLTKSRQIKAKKICARSPELKFAGSGRHGLQMVCGKQPPKVAKVIGKWIAGPVAVLG